MDKVERHGKAIINGQEVAFRSECGDYPVKMRTVTRLAAYSFTPISAKTAKKTDRSCLHSTEGRDRPACGCTWGCWGRSTLAATMWRH